MRNNGLKYRCLRLKMFSHFGFLSIAMITVMLTACGNDDAFDNGERLLVLASQTDAAQTRTTINNVWSGGERVQISINDADATTFTAAWYGMLTPVDAIYWRSATQTVSARGWHPASWVFPTNQSTGIQAADFIFAPTVSGITFRNANNTPLTFHHRTAKVTVNLTAGQGVGSIADATIAFYGYTVGTPDTSDAGNGVIVGSGSGWITPYNTNGDSYVALLIPRNMTDERFIRITLNSFDFFFTPASGQANLQQGNSYTYNITLHKDRLEVTVVGGGVTWDSGNSYTVEGGRVET